MVEIVVVCAILSITAGAGTWMIVGMITSYNEASSRLNQFTTAERVNAFLGTRLASTEANGLGMATTGLPVLHGDAPSPDGIASQIGPTGAGLLPSSVSGDQIVFKRGSTCYRIMFIKKRKEIWLAGASGTDSCDSMASSTGVMRGPNQEIHDAPFGPSDEPYDPVLDSILTETDPTTDVSLLLLADNVIPAGATPVFRLFDIRENEFSFDAAGRLGTDNPVYLGETGLELPTEIAEIRATYKIQSGIRKVADRKFVQSFFLTQVCEPVS